MRRDMLHHQLAIAVVAALDVHRLVVKRDEGGIDRRDRELGHMVAVAESGLAVEAVAQRVGHRGAAQALQIGALAAERLQHLLQRAVHHRGRLLDALDPVGGLFQQLQIGKERLGGGRLEVMAVDHDEVLGRVAFRAFEARALDPEQL